MEFGRVLQISLDDKPQIGFVPQELSIDLLPLLLRHLFEVIQWEELGHRPPIEVVGVPIEDVTEGLLVVVVTQMGLLACG